MVRAEAPCSRPLCIRVCGRSLARAIFIPPGGPSRNLQWVGLFTSGLNCHVHDCLCSPAARATIPTRILRNRLLTRLGVMSYGLYVYSWIVLVFSEQLTSHPCPGCRLASST